LVVPPQSGAGCFGKLVRGVLTKLINLQTVLAKKDKHPAAAGLNHWQL